MLDQLCFCYTKSLRKLILCTHSKYSNTKAWGDVCDEQWTGDISYGVLTTSLEGLFTVHSKLIFEQSFYVLNTSFFSCLPVALRGKMDATLDVLYNSSDAA